MFVLRVDVQSVDKQYALLGKDQKYLLVELTIKLIYLFNLDCTDLNIDGGLNCGS